MFARPPHENRRLAVEVTFADGSRQPLDLPWLAHEGLYGGWRHMRVRELQDRLRGGQRFFVARPERVYVDVCRYAAEHVAGPAGFAAQRVELVDYVSPIPPPTLRYDWVDYVALLRFPEEEERKVLFEYVVAGGGS
jgi:hypothetical protein